jgi:hypothetical protein|tara:strand:+ start:262 stop:624 length:363 start_codon:yes stop_codon:yes gene_type:complete
MVKAFFIKNILINDMKLDDGRRRTEGGRRNEMMKNFFLSSFLLSSPSSPLFSLLQTTTTTTTTQDEKMYFWSIRTFSVFPVLFFFCSCQLFIVLRYPPHHPITTPCYFNINITLIITLPL